MLLRRETTGKAHSAGTALMGKRAPCSMELLSFRKLVEPHWQRAAPLSATGRCAGRIFCFTSKALAAGRSPWSAAGLSGTQPCGVTLGETRDHPASFCSPSTRKQHPGKHSCTEAAIREQIWPTESRKTYFSNVKNITKTQKESFTFWVGFFFN